MSLNFNSLWIKRLDINIDIIISLTVITLIGLLSFLFFRNRAQSLLIQGKPLRSMPNYHGLFVILSSLLPCIIFLIVFISIDGFIKGVIIQNHLPNSLILLGREEVDFSVSILRNNIHNLHTLIYFLHYLIAYLLKTLQFLL